MTPRFDRYVVVDWSAAGKPTTGSDSIWIAELEHDGQTRLSNVPTRSEAQNRLGQIVEGSERVLIGVDVCLGYPRGSAALFGLSAEPWHSQWKSTWQTIADLSSDDARNVNNRFDVAAHLNRRAGGVGGVGGPFWGCPNDDRAPDLRRTKPSSFAVPEFRTTEERLRQRGRYPKSAWQLFGAGSVGGQTLTMIPMLHAMLDTVDVWPFTTGLMLPSTSRVVVAEVWPSRFVDEIPVGMVPDAAQVSATVQAIRQADVAGSMNRWFEPDLPDADIVTSEEGWILGVA